MTLKEANKKTGFMLMLNESTPTLTKSKLCKIGILGVTPLKINVNRQQSDLIKSNENRHTVERALAKRVW